ncbi:7800_t:CDS:10 [Ambispora leptoticha]|uniref:Translation initiation factor eIF2B subunit gamma n=1 Tax=Ambispora leptoticha TaxID=144679 RepID=A0A9N8WB63_9GLOM|nr:7800_t:CDS:10 [Ambispora leptoticha]
MLLFDSGKKKTQQTQQGRYAEFQAIVLAGFGNYLYPLTEDNNLPKALLPIANKPMIYYVLDWLERAGIFDVMIIAQQSGEQKISSYIKNIYEGKLKPSLEVVRDEHGGTADVLRSVKDKIRSDFIVVSCDLILDLVPHEFLDYHRREDPAFTAFFYEPSKSESGNVTGTSSSKDDSSKLFIGVEPTRSRFVYIKSRDDLDQELTLRMSLLWKFPRVNIHTTLQDAHLYIFKRWVIDLIAQRKSISSVKEHLVPLLLKCQYQKKLLEMEGINKRKTQENFQKRALEYSTTWEKEDDDEYPVRCHIYIFKNGFCGRGNTVPSYCELNRHMAKMSTGNRVSLTAEIPQKAQVGNDSMIGEHTKIDERTSIKRSTVGAHCVIGKNVKINNSILMDHVIVQDFVKLDGCVVCNNAKIEEKVQLKDCEVGGGFVVESGLQAKNEQLYRWKDGYALALGLGSLFNHSRNNNVGYVRDFEANVIRYYTLCDIESGKELCINYDEVEEIDKLFLEGFQLEEEGEFWSEKPANIDGMLGGFGSISNLDIKTSELFLSEYTRGKRGTRNMLRVPPRIVTKYACDCGAGIGRITKNLLTKMFDRVDLVEQTPKFIQHAQNEHLRQEVAAGKIGEFYCVGLQEFSPDPGRYDLIWCQWVLEHLTDDDLVAFFVRSKKGLRPDSGIICVKENVNVLGYTFDEEVCSVVRSDQIFKDIFHKAGLKVLKESTQHGFPKDLFPVKIYALAPESY